MEATKNITQSTETPQISTETAEAENEPTEGTNAAEMPENAHEVHNGMEPYNVEYYIREYGNIDELRKTYKQAYNDLQRQYFDYEINHRKGGRYRREKMTEISRKAQAIFDEYLQVKRAMEEYFVKNAAESPQSPETPQTAECVDKHRKLTQTA